MGSYLASSAAAALSSEITLSVNCAVVICTPLACVLSIQRMFDAPLSTV
jgi:hypothetical protein